MTDYLPPTESETRNILSQILSRSPRPTNLRDFSEVDATNQTFMNHLLELNKRGLITGKFNISRMVETYGLPLDICLLEITEKGREFLEGKSHSTPVGHVFNNTITVNASGQAKAPIQIAGRDILHNENCDDDLLEVLKAIIEKSALSPEKKESASGAIKSFFIATGKELGTDLIKKAIGLIP